MRGRLVMLMQVVPKLGADNAGQNFVGAQVRHWMHDWDVTALIMPGSSSRRELDEAICPTYVIPSPAEDHRGRAGVAIGSKLRSWLPTLPEPHMTMGLKDDPATRRSIREADVIVLQWQHTAALAPVVRRLNPDAIIVAVLHDVMSQAHDREARHANSTKWRCRQRWAAFAARIIERCICRTADRVMVLSAKDADLLPQLWQDKLRIVPAPIAAHKHSTTPPPGPRIVIVSSWRRENLQGLEWFTQLVLPHVRFTVPGVQVRLIGNNLLGSAAEHALRSQGYDIAGFVPDLAAEYAEASVAAIPLWLGGGVKFKTVEAILHGVPIVATSVGAEGIPLLAGYDGVTDDPTRFAEKLIASLKQPMLARQTISHLRGKILDAHSPMAFTEAMDSVLD